jgi:ferric-dicitrate binding protein FerR (iron transport regulator)
MSVPHYAWLVRKLYAGGGESIAPPPPSGEDRARAIDAIAGAIASRARKRRARRWAGAAFVAAAVVAGVFVGSRVGGAPAHSAAVAAARPEIVAHPAAGGASVLVSGAEGPLVEGRSLAAGSRIMTPPGGRATLSFSTGTIVSLGEGADVTVGGDGNLEQLRLAAGLVDLHVAKLGPGQRFVVDTADAEVEVRGTQFRVAVADPDPGCGAGTTTRVTVTEGVVTVRHSGTESRVAAGERWPAVCGRASAGAEVPPSDTASSSRASARPFEGGRAGPVSALAEQNDLFARGSAARRHGDVQDALTAFDRLVAKYPACVLAESASVERMRLLRTTAPARAVVTAEQYLARYPTGFARAEAEAIVSGTP